MSQRYRGITLNDWIKGGNNPMRLFAACLLGILLLAQAAPAAARPGSGSQFATSIREAELPLEARETLALIRQGGPFPYARDGAVFANREGRLPFVARKTYREYTVKTPHSRDRGARRIIAGKNKFWYTADHYRSFRLIVE